MILSGQVASPAGGGTTKITILCNAEISCVYLYYVLNNEFFAEALSSDEITDYTNGTTREVDSHSIFYIRVGKFVVGNRPVISNAIAKNTDKLSTNIDNLGTKYDSYLVTYLAN